MIVCRNYLYVFLLFSSPCPLSLSFGYGDYKHICPWGWELQGCTVKCWAVFLHPQEEICFFKCLSDSLTAFWQNIHSLVYSTNSMVEDISIRAPSASKALFPTGNTSSFPVSVHVWVLSLVSSSVRASFPKPEFGETAALCLVHRLQRLGSSQWDSKKERFFPIWLHQRMEVMG